MSFSKPSGPRTRYASSGRRATLLALACAVVAATVAATPVSAPAAKLTSTVNDLQAAGSIDAKTAEWAKDAYADARSVRRRTTGSRRAVMRYVIRVAENLANSDRLSAGRVRPVFSILERNAGWFRHNGPAAEGTDRRFGKSRIIYQYFGGRGWQIHPLSNFAKLNAVWTVKSKPARRALGEYAHELIGLAVNRGGFLTWEYYFDFGGGAPPWTSSISQGTAVQALARAGNALKDDTITDAARQAIGAFETDAPVGVRVTDSRGPHFLIYSFNSGLRVLNAFLQSLDGLRDYSQITNDDRAYQLYLKALEVARAETAKSDTGAWSLYSVGGNESSLHYHQLLTGFLGKLCDVNREEIFCSTRDRFRAYTKQDPRISSIKARVRKGRVYVTFRLSKVSRVGISASMSGDYAGGSSSTVGYGVRRFSFAAPDPGVYSIKVSATDLAGNSAFERAKLRVRRRGR